MIVLNYDINALVKPLLFPKGIYIKKIQTSSIVLKRPGKLSCLPLSSTKLNYGNISTSNKPRRNSRFIISEIVTINIVSKPIIYINSVASSSATSNFLTLNFEVSERSEHSSNRLSQLFPENYSDIQQEVNDSRFDTDSVLRSAAGSNHNNNDNKQNKDSYRKKSENVGFRKSPNTRLISSEIKQEICSIETDNHKKYNIVISCLDDGQAANNLNESLINIKEILQVSIKSPLDFEKSGIRRQTQSLPKIIKGVKSSIICPKIKISKFTTPSKPTEKLESDFTFKSDKNPKLKISSSLKSQNIEKKTKKFSNSLSLKNKVFKSVESSPYNFQWEKKILRSKIKLCVDKSISKLPEVYQKKIQNFQT